MMDVLLLISAISMLVVSIGCIFGARMLSSGIFLISAQAGASGAFVTIALLHLLPEACTCWKPGEKWPMHYFITAVTFGLLSVIDTVDRRNRSEKGSTADKDIGDCSLLLVNHFSAIPSVVMQTIIMVFMVGHSVVLGLLIWLKKDAETYIPVIVATLFEKAVEMFTVSLIIARGFARGRWFWIVVVAYSLATPVTMVIAMEVARIPDSMAMGTCLSVSTGLFLFIGIALWKKTFLTPFDWRWGELVVVVLVFTVSIGVQSVTCVNQYPSM